MRFFFFVQIRLGGDSQLTFGHCSLCVHPAVEPMATPSGHVYCKECIVEFLLAKTQELKRQREAFEAQEKTKGKYIARSPGSLVSSFMYEFQVSAAFYSIFRNSGNE